jgi:hypothetical protein
MNEIFGVEIHNICIYTCYMYIKNYKHNDGQMNNLIPELQMEGIL